MKIFRLVIVTFFSFHNCIHAASKDIEMSALTGGQKKPKKQLSPAEQWKANMQLFTTLNTAQEAVNAGKTIDKKVLTERIEKDIESGADVNTHFTTNSTPLILASQGRLDEAVQLLIRRGARVGQGSIQWTPLFNAIFDENVEKGTYDLRLPIQKTISFIKILLSQDATNSIHNVTFGGQNILFSTVVDDKAAEITQLLLEYGANPLHKDDRGKTALDFASPANKKIIENFLRQQEEIRKAAKAPVTETAVGGQLVQEAGTPKEPIMIPGNTGIRSQIAEFLFGCPEGEVSAPAGARAGEFVEPEK